MPKQVEAHDARFELAEAIKSMDDLTELGRLYSLMFPAEPVTIVTPFADAGPFNHGKLPHETTDDAFAQRVIAEVERMRDECERLRCRCRRVERELRSKSE